MASGILRQSNNVVHAIDHGSMKDDLLHRALTQRLIGSYFEVYHDLGFGFLEVVYQRALAIALEESGIRFRQQALIDVQYRGRQVGRYFADFLVEDVVIIELKACRTIEPNHESQLLNYLRGTDVEVGLLFNFGEKRAFRRMVYSNDRKADRGQRG